MKGGGGRPSPAARTAMTSSLDRLLERAIRALDTFLAAAVLAMVALACANAALRYLWGGTLVWADETLIFAMIGVSFLGLIGVAHRRGQLRMSLLSQMLPARAARVLRGLDLAVTAAVCLFVAKYSLDTVGRLKARGTLSNMAEVPLWAMHALVLAGLVGMALIALLQLGLLLTGREDAR